MSQNFTPRGHDRTAGLNYAQVTLGGKQYTLRPLLVGMYAEMEAYYLSLRKDPCAQAMQLSLTLPKDQHQAMWQAAFTVAANLRIVTASEWSEFESSPRGLAFKFLCFARQDHPELRLDTVEASVNNILTLLEATTEAEYAELLAAMMRANEEAALKNSSGPTETSSTPLGGPKSTAPSPTPTSGPPT